MADFKLTDNDFGFSNSSNTPTPDTKADKMYKLILPLLKNLMKGPDNIHWPNRKEKIEDFIKKLDAIKDE